ncbi:hypothetical protein BDZ91DRAFT_759683 [Kalaharituber pfeilii]|nr:hypothetical protein BDZ91DRAFT_759683 [Kalaharituber pfeilii]
MSSILTSPELLLSPGGSKRERARLVKKTKTTPSRPRTSTGASTNTASRPRPLPLPKLSDFERRSLTDKRAEADNMPLPPPIKITPLGQVVAGGFPPTPPGSYSSSSGGELTAASLAMSRTGSSQSRFLEEISPPLLREEKVVRPTSAGSLFSRRKSRDRTPKERDTSTFFGRDGELGDIQKPDMPPRSIFKGRSHSRSASSITTKSMLGPGANIPPAIVAVPPTAELERQHPALRSPPGTVATTITTTTTHYRLSGEPAEEKHQSFLPPLHLPQLELTFDGTPFQSAKRPSPSTTTLSGSERRIEHSGSFHESGSSNEVLRSGPSSSNSSRQAFVERKSDKRPTGPIKPAPLFAGQTRESRESPPISFYNSTQEMYHRHLRQESTPVAPRMSRETARNSTDRFLGEVNSSPSQSVQGLKRATLNAKDRRRSRSEVGARQVRKSADVEEVFRDIEKTKNGGKDTDNRGSGFVTIGGDYGSKTSSRHSQQDDILSEFEKRLDNGKGRAEEQVESTESSPIQSENAIQGFIFPFAQAVTVDEPVELPSANVTVSRSQSNPISPVSMDLADVRESCRSGPEVSSRGEVVRPKTAPSAGITQRESVMGLGIGTDDLDRGFPSSGFVGGYKLDNLMYARRRFSREGGRFIPSQSTSTSSGSSTASNNPNTSTVSGQASLPRVGHVRKFSYPTIEGMALAEEAKAGAGREVTLSDLLVDEQSEQAQCQNPQQWKPLLRPVTVIEPRAEPSAAEIVLADGTVLPAPGTRKPRSRAESPHWEPMVPVDRKKEKEKRRQKRRWFGSHKKDRERSEHEDDHRRTGSGGLQSGMSNASSSSKYSTGSSSSGGSHQKCPSASGSERSLADTLTPPGSSSGQGSLSMLGRGGSALELSRGATEFPYTSQAIAAAAAATHPDGPPHLNRMTKSGDSTPASSRTPTPSVGSINQTSIPITTTQTRGRTRTRESGLRYEVRGSPSPIGSNADLATTPPAFDAAATVPSGSSLSHRHDRTPSQGASPSAHRKQRSDSSNSIQQRPQGKLFVVCCNCEYWHDLPKCVDFLALRVSNLAFYLGNGMWGVVRGEEGTGKPRYKFVGRLRTGKKGAFPFP